MTICQISLVLTIVIGAGAGLVQADAISNSAWVSVPTNVLSESEQAAIMAREQERRTEWFDESLLRCTSLTRPNPETLGGQYFVIARSYNLNEAGYVRTRQNLRELHKMGVTDIIQLLIAGNSTYFPTDDKDAVYRYFVDADKDYDTLMVLVKAAAEEKIGVWCKLQVPGPRDREAPLGLKKEFWAADMDGNSYGPKQKEGDIPDILNPDYRVFLKRMIDILAGKYNKYGNMKGFNIDMPWDNRFDMMEKHLDIFSEFCRDKFHETPDIPAIAAKLKQDGYKWHEPDDKWWRRFILFKRWANEDFVKDISSYCKSKGLKFILQVDTFTTRPYWRGWWAGIATVQHGQYADWVWAYPGSARCEPCYIMSRSMSGTFYGYTSTARNIAYSFRGQMAGIHVFYATTMGLPMLAGGTTPRLLEEVKRHIVTTREWAGAQSLTRVGLLYNHDSALLRGILYPRAEPNDYLLMDRIGRYLDVDRLFVEMTDAYKQYNVLLVTENSASRLSEPVMEKLKKFVATGGTIITLGYEWSVANEDQTEIKGLTQMLAGLPASTTRAAETFDIYEQSSGQGRIITVKSPDIFMALSNANPKIEKQFADLIKSRADAPVTLENSSDNPANAQMMVVTTLKKNNWVGVSLLPDFMASGSSRVQQAVSANVRVDVDKLGIKAKRFRILLLKRNMELLKKVVNRGDRNWSKPLYRGRGDEGFWSADDLRQGVKVTIAPDNEFDLCVPGKVPVPPDAVGMVKHYYQSLPEQWVKTAGQRDYMYEIMVVAPADELTIEGEKIKDADM